MAMSTSNSEGEGRILLDGPLAPESHHSAKVTVGNRRGTAVEAEQRLSLRHKVTNACR